VADLGLFLGLRDCHGGCFFPGSWWRLVLGLDEDARVKELHGIGLAGEVRGLSMRREGMRIALSESGIGVQFVGVVPRPP
jgi:hypothetical protein